MQKTEVTELQFDTAFEVLPPIYINTIDGKPIAHGFAVSEPFTHNAAGAVVSVYWKEGDNHYTALCNLTDKAGRPVHFTDLFHYIICKAFSHE